MVRRLGDDETAVLRELNADAASYYEREPDDHDEDYPDEMHRYRDHYEPRYTPEEIDDFFRLCEENEPPF